MQQHFAGPEAQGSAQQHTQDHRQELAAAVPEEDIREEPAQNDAAPQGEAVEEHRLEEGKGDDVPGALQIPPAEEQEGQGRQAQAHGSEDQRRDPAGEMNGQEVAGVRVPVGFIAEEVPAQGVVGRGEPVGPEVPGPRPCRR